MFLYEHATLIKVTRKNICNMYNCEKLGIWSIKISLEYNYGKPLCTTTYFVKYYYLFTICLFPLFSVSFQWLCSQMSPSWYSLVLNITSLMSSSLISLFKIELQSPECFIPLFPASGFSMTPCAKLPSSSFIARGPLYNTIEISVWKRSIRKSLNGQEKYERICDLTND